MAYSEEGTITLKMIAKDLMSGNVGKAIAGLDKLAQKGGLVGSVAQGVGQSFGQMLNPLGLVTKGIGMVTDVIGDAISKAADEQEEGEVGEEGVGHIIVILSAAKDLPCLL